MLTGVAFVITLIFKADVDAQGGAYATGVLVLITSASVAVTLAARRCRQRWQMVGFGLVTLVFVYTTIDNVVERPDGVKIGGCFIAAIVLVSIASRLSRAFELRTTEVEYDVLARTFLRDCARRSIRLVAKEPDASTVADFQEKLNEVVDSHDLTDPRDILFVEVTVKDYSDFEGRIDVHGAVLHERFRVLTVEASSVPNALAALLLSIQEMTHVRPHIYFEWTEGNPLRNLLQFLFFGLGEVAPVTREVLRRAQPDRAKRPHVHAG